MFKINVLVFFVLVSSRFVNGQLESLIGLPIEYNTFQEYDNWESELNNDIWSEDGRSSRPEDDSPGKLLETLCTKYDLELNNQIIDCENVQIVPKSLRLTDHNVRKREAPEDILEEGSGDDSPADEPKESKADSSPEEPKIPEVPAQTIEETKEVAADTITPAVQEKQDPAVVPSEDKVQTVEETTTSHPAEPEKQEPAAVASGDKVQTVEESTTAHSVEPEKQEPAVVPVEANNDTGSSPFKTQSLGIPVEEQKVPEAAGNEKPAEVPKEPATETQVKEGENVKSDKAELSETSGKGQESEAKKDGAQLTQEEINTHQSGVAIVNGGADIIETDKTLRGLKPNESIKSDSTATKVEEPKSGASETNEKSRKDNKLLITLFVAVLAVGAIAFAYNFIKKRKNKNLAASLEAQNNGTQKTADPEEGREMKPLMTSPQQKNNVEYKDEK